MKHVRAYLALFFTVTFVVSPALTRPFSGFRADQLPIPQIAPPVQPAGYAFAIWGLIYAGLVGAAIYGVWQRADHPGWDRARPALIVSLAVGTPWLAVANTSAIWATILIFVMTGSAIVALFKAPHDLWTFKVPVGLYAGWLTATSFVSLGTTAAGYGLLMGQVYWAYAGIIGALTVATFVITKTMCAAYGIAVIWALVGIIVANGSDQMSVTLLAALGAMVLAGLTLMVSQRQVIS